VLGDVGHQGADRVVAAKVTPDLLLDQLGGFRAQHQAGAALVGLELIEDELDLPPLVAGRGGSVAGTWSGSSSAVNR